MFQQEISLIILQSLFLYFFFKYSIFNQKIQDIVTKNKFLTNTDLITLNILVFLNIFIFFTIFKIKIAYFFYTYLFLLFFMLLKNFNQKKLHIDYKDLIIILITIILSLDLAYELIFGWDVQWFWYFKALNLYSDQSFLNLKTLPVPDYPHLGPYIWGFFWKFPFNNYEYLGRIVYIFFYIIAIFSFSETLKINNQLRFIFSLLIILATYKYDLFNGDPDILIFTFLLFASKFILYLYDPINKKNHLILIILLLGISNILFWLKNEAIFFIIFLILSVIIFNRLIDKRNKIILITSSIFLIIIKFAILEMISYPVIDTGWYEFEKTSSFKLSDFYYRSTIIIFYIVAFIIRNPILIVTLPLMIFSIKILKKNALNKTLLSFTLMIFIFVFSAYFLKAVEIELQIKNSMGELLFGISGLYLIIFTNIFNSYLHNNKNKMSK
mgnify:CR=1 FL=1